MKKADINNSSNFDRRKTLKTVLGGAGLTTLQQSLPATWIKPVLSTAIVPAHAATSEYVQIGEFSAEPIDSEQTSVSLEFSTFNVPNGTEVEVTFSSSNDLINEGNNWEATIQSEGSEAGYPVWNEGTPTQFELEGTAPSDLELEISFESGSGIPDFEAETTIPGAP